MSFNRQQFIADICSLVGTPFRHQGNSEQTGLDCIHICRAAYRMQGLELPSELDAEFEGYTNQPDGWKLQATMKKYFEQVEIAEPGDLLNIYVRRNPKHLAVLVGENEIVEAYQSMDRSINETVKHALNPRRRIAAIFRIPDAT